MLTLFLLVENACKSQFRSKHSSQLYSCRPEVIAQKSFCLCSSYILAPEIDFELVTDELDQEMHRAAWIDTPS